MRSNQEILSKKRELLAAKVRDSMMQPNAFGSIKPAQLPHGLLILFRSGQNSGWKIVSCGVHFCGLEQKKIRMGNRVSCSNQLRTEGESK